MPANQKVLERASQTRDRALEDLKLAVDLGKIRNADLVELKFQIGNAWSDERGALPDLLTRPNHPHTDMDRIWYEIVQLPPYSLHHITVIPKRLPAILKKVDEPDARITAAAEALTILYERWLPLANLIEQVKPLVVKGRKPSETPVDSRTLENTGSCSCCQRNIKLKDLKIVDHGFQVDEGRHGQCFGVGYYPIEISTEGLDALIKHFERRIEKAQAHLKQIENDEIETYYGASRHTREAIGRDSPKFRRARMAAAESVKSDIGGMKAQSKMAGQIMASWKPRKLPDGAGHFALEDASPAPTGPR